MNAHLLDLYLLALETAALLAFPVVALVGAVGVVVGVLQAMTGISDQNLSFGPKIAAVAAACAWGGSMAFSVMETLLQSVMHSLPQLAL